MEKTLGVISFDVDERDFYSVITFTLNVEALAPSALADINPPSVNFKKGVVISGRGPIWLYGFLTHIYHPAKFTATHDPRLGAVVNATHTPEVTVGQILPM